MLFLEPLHRLRRFVVRQRGFDIMGAESGSGDAHGEVAVFEEGAGGEAAQVGQQGAAVGAVRAENGGREVQAVFGDQGDALVYQAFDGGVVGAGRGQGVAGFGAAGHCAHGRVGEGGDEGGQRAGFGPVVGVVHSDDVAPGFVGEGGVECGGFAHVCRQMQRRDLLMLCS